MKTIIIFCNSSWNIYNFRKNLISELKKKYRVIIISGKDEYSTKVKNYTESYFLNLENRSLNPIKNFEEILSLRKIINKKPVCTIINFTNKSIIIGTYSVLFKKIRVINVITGLGHIYFLSNIFVKFIIKFLYLFVYWRSDLIITQNKHDQKYLTQQFFTNKKVKLIYGSGIDTDFFSPSNRIKKKNKTFLFIGRIIKEKGIFNYLEAAAYFKHDSSILFNIVGELNYKNFSNKETDRLKKLLKTKNIKLMKFKKNNLKIINDCDCVILPSYREGLSKSLLEATAMKKFVICSDVPGCNEIIKENYNGFLFKKNDTEDLILKIKKFLSLSKKKILIMENNSRKKTLSLFSDKVIIKKYLSLIKNLSNNL